MATPFRVRVSIRKRTLPTVSALRFTHEDLPMAMLRCEMLVVFGLTLFCGRSFAQNNAHHADLSDLPITLGLRRP